jgi:hypothetical protein
VQPVVLRASARCASTTCASANCWSMRITTACRW